MSDYQKRQIEAIIDAYHRTYPNRETQRAAMLRAMNSIPLPQESELVEVMAAAMWRKDYPRGGSRVKSWDSNSHEDKELYRNDARSALNALRPALAAMAGNGGCEQELGMPLEKLTAKIFCLTVVGYHRDDAEGKSFEDGFLAAVEAVGKNVRSLLALLPPAPAVEGETTPTAAGDERGGK